MIPARACLASGLLLLAPAVAQAQAWYGVAEWAFGRGYYGTEATHNNNVAQSYTLGYRGVIWDPRFFRYDGQVAYRRTSLTFGEQDGRSRDTGFAFNGTLFGARAFPLSIEVFRGKISESGDFPSSSIIRGGLTYAPGEAIPDFLTRRSGLQLNWQLNSERLPRVQLGYRKGSWHGSGGGVSGLQRDSDLDANVEKDMGGTRHTLRYHRNGTTNEINNVYNQRLSDLAYELTTTKLRRGRAGVRAGRRSSYSLFDLPPAVIDAGVPSPGFSRRGASTVYYAQGSVTYEPTTRLSLDVALGFDREATQYGDVGSLLVSSGARIEVVKGLSVNGRGTTGLRDQKVGSTTTSVRTSNGSLGMDYSKEFKVFTVSVGGQGFTGMNESTIGETGRIRGFAGHADAGTAFSKGVNIRGGYDRSRAVDELLDSGNQDVERLRLSAASQITSRLAIEASWENTMTVRGRTEVTARNRVVVGSGSVACRLTQRAMLRVSAGQFNNLAGAEFGDDRRHFASASLDVPISAALTMNAVARGERESLSLNGREQTIVDSLAKIEYRLRLFSFGVEHRYTQSRQSLVRGADSVALGNQFLIRLSRRFGR